MEKVVNWPKPFEFCLGTISPVLGTAASSSLTSTESTIASTGHPQPALGMSTSFMLAALRVFHIDILGAPAMAIRMSTRCSNMIERARQQASSSKMAVDASASCPRHPAPLGLRLLVPKY